MELIDNISCLLGDLLFQKMSDWGVDLAPPIARQSTQGKSVFFVDGNTVKITVEQIFKLLLPATEVKCI